MDLSQIINTENTAIPTKPIKTLGEDFVWVSQKTELNGNEVILYETDKPFVLDYAEFSGKNSLGFAGVFIYTKIGGTLTQISRCINTDASVSNPLASTQFENIFKYGSSMFNMYAYDLTTSTAKIALKEQMYFPNGVRIAVKCSSGAATVASLFSERVVK